MRPTVEGSEPWRWLKLTSNTVSLLRKPISGGRQPVRLSLRRMISLIVLATEHSKIRADVGTVPVGGEIEWVGEDGGFLESRKPESVSSMEIDDDGGAVSDNDAGKAPALDSCCDGDAQLLSTAYGCVGVACGCSKGPTGSLEVVARCPGCGGARRSPVRGGHTRRRSYRN
ncbi:unnamed protein product [Camellia sinensis]